MIVCGVETHGLPVRRLISQCPSQLPLRKHTPVCIANVYHTRDTIFCFIFWIRSVGLDFFRLLLRTTPKAIVDIAAYSNGGNMTCTWAKFYGHFFTFKLLVVHGVFIAIKQIHSLNVKKKTTTNSHTRIGYKALYNNKYHGPANDAFFRYDNDNEGDEKMRHISRRRWGDTMAECCDCSMKIKPIMQLCSVQNNCNFSLSRVLFGLPLSSFKRCHMTYFRYVHVGPSTFAAFAYICGVFVWPPLSLWCFNGVFVHFWHTIHDISSVVTLTNAYSWFIRYKFGN